MLCGFVWPLGSITTTIKWFYCHNNNQRFIPEIQPWLVLMVGTTWMQNSIWTMYTSQSHGWPQRSFSKWWLCNHKSSRVSKKILAYLAMNKVIAMSLIVWWPWTLKSKISIYHNDCIAGSWLAKNDLSQKFTFLLHMKIFSCWALFKE